VSEEVNRKCPSSSRTVQLSASTPTLRYKIGTALQTDNGTVSCQELIVLRAWIG